MKPQVSMMHVTCPYCDYPSEIVFHTEPLPPKQSYEGGRPPYVPSYIPEAEGDILKGRDGELVDPSTGRLLLCDNHLPPPHVPTPPMPPSFPITQSRPRKRRSPQTEVASAQPTVSPWLRPK